ncbi:MAG: HD domain-containing protein [Sphaerochaetaceae bacterium]
MESRQAKNQIAHLMGEFNFTVRDPLWKDIVLSKGFKTLLAHSEVQKLSRIKQLGPVYLLYPGAVHTRLDHSLGVYHLSRLILLKLLANKMNSPHATLTFSDEGITAFLTAALLHDVGHFPYAHALKDNIRATHESLGVAIINESRSLKQIIEDELKTSVEAVCQIIDTTLACDEQELLFYRSLLSGTLDPDKLDYLSRDALFCGVPYGVQDAAYIIRHLKVNAQSLLYLPLEAIGGVEHLLFAKYSMYKNVYWHSAVRSATATIKKALFLALERSTLHEEELFGLDDEGLYYLLERIESPDIYNLAIRVRNNALLEEKAHCLYAEVQHTRLLNDKHYTRAVEEAIWNALKGRYRELSPLEVIIDIPEKLSFEGDLLIEMEDGTLQEFAQVDPLFGSSMVELFTTSIRKVALFLPPYVDSKDAKAIFTEKVDNYG